MILWFICSLSEKPVSFRLNHLFHIKENTYSQHIGLVWSKIGNWIGWVENRLKLFNILNFKTKLCNSIWCPKIPTLFFPINLIKQILHSKINLAFLLDLLFTLDRGPVKSWESRLMGLDNWNVMGRWCLMYKKNLQGVPLFI
jgi:hypothetical protein